MPHATRANTAPYSDADCWIESFLAADAVDRLIVGIVPVLLGGGRPLFPGEHATIELRLTDLTVHQGKVRLVYPRR